MITDMPIRPEASNSPTEAVSPFLTPAETKTRLGVSRKTLLRWERAGVISPLRLPSGHRRYRVEDVERIERGA